MNRVVAIDGPSASGKSTVARQLAERIGFVYVDSGSLYRGMAWKALTDGINVDDVKCLDRLAGSASFEFFLRKRAVRFRVDGRELDKELRTVEVDRTVSAVAAVPAIRTRVVGWLRDMTRFGDLVMEGRDIGTAVFPATEHKFYLDASPEQRARRRHTDARCGNRSNMDDTKALLEKRDSMDSRREIDPLRVPEGAMVVDSTNMSVDEVVDRILAALPGGWRAT